MKMIHARRLFAVQVSERIYRIPVGAVVRMQAGDDLSYSPSEDFVDALPPLGEAVGEEQGQPAGV
jgi:hypothetical protein